MPSVGLSAQKLWEAIFKETRLFGISGKFGEKVKKSIFSCVLVLNRWDKITLRCLAGQKGALWLFLTPAVFPGGTLNIEKLQITCSKLHQEMPDCCTESEMARILTGKRSFGAADVV